MVKSTAFNYLNSYLIFTSNLPLVTFFLLPAASTPINENVPLMRYADFSVTSREPLPPGKLELKSVPVSSTLKHFGSLKFTSLHSSASTLYP